MTVKINKIDMLLLSYATGYIGRYKYIVVITILILSKKARKRLALFEEIGGDLLAKEKPLDIHPDSLEKIIKIIDKNI